MDGNQPHLVPNTTDWAVLMVRTFQSMDSVAQKVVSFCMKVLIPIKHSGVTLLPCGITTLYGRVVQKRKEVQNTAQEETTQYLKGNALTVQKGNCESETPSLSQSPYRKQKETIKSIPVNEAIETGVKVSAV